MLLALEQLVLAGLELALLRRHRLRSLLDGGLSCLVRLLEAPDLAAELAGVPVGSLAELLGLLPCGLLRLLDELVGALLGRTEMGVGHPFPDHEAGGPAERQPHDR